MLGCTCHVKIGQEESRILLIINFETLNLWRICSKPLNRFGINNKWIRLELTYLSCQKKRLVETEKMGCQTVDTKITKLGQTNQLNKQKSSF